MSIKSFSTANSNAPESALEGAEPIEFDVDGETWTAYPPTAGQLALIMAAQSEYSTPVERVRGMIDLLDSILDEEHRARYRERLMDREDTFEFDTVEAILEYLIEQWSARPPTKPADYLPSQRSTGKQSTGKRRSPGAKAS